MNITINQITNGWIVAIASPKGQTATFCENYEAVIKLLMEIAKPADNVAELPRQ
jgi:hypothetical protein